MQVTISTQEGFSKEQLSPVQVPKLVQEEARDEDAGLVVCGRVVVGCVPCSVISGWKMPVGTQETTPDVMVHIYKKLSPHKIASSMNKIM